MNRSRRKLLFVFVILFLVITGGFFKLKQARDRVFVGNSVTRAGANQAGDSFSGNFHSNQPFNILLLGFAGGDHDGAYLTDSMIVVNINPAIKKITLISIPRDIWVTIPTNGTVGSHWKINAAYELGLDDSDYSKKLDTFKGLTGGGNLAKYTVEQVTGLHINRFVALDFSGFTKTIDSLGGVDINVQRAFDDIEYPIAGRESDLCGHPPSDLPTLEQIATISASQAFPCRYEQLHFDQGLQHMSGETALKYVRSRHSLQDGTDFGRSNRQRNLLVAVKNKVFSANLLTSIVPFINSLQNSLTTDLSVQEVQDVVAKASVLNGYQINNIALSDKNVLVSSYTDDGQYILTSRNGLDSWSDIRQWVLSALDPSKRTSSPIIKVENGTRIAGLATLAVNRLQDRDYNTLPPTNNDSKDAQQTSIIVNNSSIDPHLISDLEAEFGVKSTVPSSPVTDTSYDILITVGQDYNLRRGNKLIN